ncbi:MAG: hypothetical protein QXV32_08270 [Conexivisphaerales archaeon]
MARGSFELASTVVLLLLLVVGLISGMWLVPGLQVNSHAYTSNSVTTFSGGTATSQHPGTLLPGFITATSQHPGTLLPGFITATSQHPGTLLPGFITATSQHPGTLLPGTASSSSSVDWAIGGYSTSTGNSIESTAWDNLPSNPSLTGVNYVLFMVNDPFASVGTLNYQGTVYTIIGVVFQGMILYSPSTSYAYPDMTVIFLIKYGTNTYLAYNSSSWGNTNLGSGKMTDSISYTTYNGVTGWWWYITTSGSTYYIMAITSSGFYYNMEPTGTTETPSGFTFTITSVGSTSSQQSGADDTFDPSVAIEVNETTSGNFLSDNPFFDAEANVGSGQFYYLGFPSTSDFNIGQNSPPSSAYASGVKIGAKYYDEFGTSSGIDNYMHTYQNIADSVETQTVTTDLPNLNIPYYYLTMSGTGKGSWSLSPGDGWTNNGQLIQITATPIGCTTFNKWTGSGTGSYTGTNNPATITMNSNISEVGSFSNYCSPIG